MDPYIRKEPFFSLCGLNCCLCPRFHTDGASRCPGCGGPDFKKQHPTCAVVTCSRKHDNVEYCFQCNDYPCPKYSAQPEKDSFITYKNVLGDFKKAQRDLKGYLRNLKRRYGYLTTLLKSYNDGKSKAFYCLAVNLLPLDDLEKIMKQVEGTRKRKDRGIKDQAQEITAMLKERAHELGIELVLRK